MSPVDMIVEGITIALGDAFSVAEAGALLAIGDVTNTHRFRQFETIAVIWGGLYIYSLVK